LRSWLTVAGRSVSDLKISLHRLIGIDAAKISKVVSILSVALGVAG
jgi:hypothetical protein